MKSKSQLLVQRQNSVLSTNSWTNYRKLLGSLCREYENWEFTKTIKLQLDAEDVAGLLETADSLSAQTHADATSHFVANQFSYLIKKYPFSRSPYRPKEEARRRFAASEVKCSYMNAQPASHFYGTRFESMRTFIKHVLGDLKLSRIYDECEFTPGASIGVHGNATNVYRKLKSHWSVSPSAFHYALAAVKRNFHFSAVMTTFERSVNSLRSDNDEFRKRFSSRVTLVKHNKIAFVPKTAKTDRSIAVEPLLNGFLQKGVDVYMRHKLARVGIDLSDQTINCEMARQGSLRDEDESYVTIDLAAASDSISIGLCKALLPLEWFEFLNSIRSKEYLLDGEVRQYSKFCSMGNGFCFPLETLLFVAACISCGCGVAPHDFRVYGDDIIVRKKYAQPLISLLAEMGFETNVDKTFISGPFRESCGRDWFEGEDVRPFVLDFALDSVQNVFKFLNLTCRNERSTAFFAGVRQQVMNLLSEGTRFLRPYQGPADSAITCEHDTFIGSKHAIWNRNLQAWSWLELVSRPARDRLGRCGEYDAILMYAALRGSNSEEPFTLRRKTRTAVIRKCYG